MLSFDASHSCHYTSLIDFARLCSSLHIAKSIKYISASILVCQNIGHQGATPMLHPAQSHDRLSQFASGSLALCYFRTFITQQLAIPPTPKPWTACMWGWLPVSNVLVHVCLALHVKQLLPCLPALMSLPHNVLAVTAYVLYVPHLPHVLKCTRDTQHLCCIYVM